MSLLLFPPSSLNRIYSLFSHRPRGEEEGDIDVGDGAINEEREEVNIERESSNTLCICPRDTL
jgi:hypothetical protein